MSAWYILVKPGIHPSCPGNTRMEITSPVFDKVEFNLDSNIIKGKYLQLLLTTTQIIYIYKKLFAEWQGVHNVTLTC